MLTNETQRRPGGLTALAVLNFVFAGFNLLGLLALAVGLVVLATVDAAKLDEARQQMDDAMGEAGIAAMVVQIGLGLVALVLQVFSAIGYLRMAPILGRMTGNAFAVVSIAGVFAGAAMGMPFSIGSVVSLIYPLLTLLLLNFTFRGDFLRGQVVPIPVPVADTTVVVAGTLQQDLAATAALRRDLVMHFGWRHALRGGGAVLYLLSLLGGGLMIAAAFISPVETLLASDKPGAAARAEEMLHSGMVVDAIGWVTGADAATSAYFVKEQPALQSAILLMLLASMPFFACLAGFNQTAGEIGTKGLRFLLLRTDRSSLFLGRFLAALLFASVGVVVLVAVTIIYLAARLDLYAFTDLLLWGAQGTLALWLVLLPHLALTAWVSAALESPMGSFSLCSAVVGLPIALLKGIVFALRKIQDIDLAWTDRLLPWGWKYDLLDPSLANRAVAAAVMVGFTVLFLWLGRRTFLRRDV